MSICGGFGWVCGTADLLVLHLFVNLWTCYVCYVCKLLNYIHIIILFILKPPPIQFSLRRACWHSLSACRYAVVFTVWYLVRVCAYFFSGVICPIIRALRRFRGPCDVAGLFVESIPDEHHCRNEHDDGNDDDNALKIQPTGTGTRTLIRVHLENSNKNTNIQYVFILFGLIFGLLIIDSMQFNIKHKDSLSCNLLVRHCVCA